MESVRQVIAGVLAALLVSVATPALAQAGRDARPALRVDDFDVEQVAQLRAGTQLRFSLFGSPGAVVALRVDGAQNDLVLQEVEPGIYEGTYTVLAGDRIGPEGRVLATLRRGEQVARAQLQEALVIGAPAPTGPDANLAAAPAAFERPLSGAPFADRPPAARPPSGRPVPAALPEAPVEPPVAATPVPQRQVACADCARVESIRPVAAEGRSRVGAVAGGVAGAIFGERIGQAHERHVTRVFGTLGSVFGGGGRGRQADASPRHEVVLRAPDGTTRVRTYDAAPPFQVGDTVRLGAGTEPATP